MKSLVLAAALLIGGAGTAQAQTDPNAPGVPPGDGITRQGTNPEGQPCTPAGFNQRLSVYPQCAAMPGTQMTSSDPPPCSRTVTDNCIQTYERGVRRAR